MKATKNVLIAYHSDCIDGFTAAWVTARALQIGSNVVLEPVGYNETSHLKLAVRLNQDSIVYDSLYLVDYSIPIEWLEHQTLNNPKLEITILDHHKSAFEMYAPKEVADIPLTPTSVAHLCPMPFVAVYLNNGRSGAGMCWHHFHTDPQLPYLVKYVQDYDLWKFEYGRTTKYINKFLRTRKKTLENWDRIHLDLEDPIKRNSAVVEGMQLQGIHDKEVARLVASAMPIRLKGQEGYYVSCAYEYVSDVGHMVAKKYDTFCAMCNLDKEDAGKEDVVWSLRSDKDWDVSILAAFFPGGGGHKNAAGFTISLEATQDLLL